MARIGIVYATTEGHTKTVAEQASRVLQQEGHETALYNVHELPRGFSCDVFDAIVVAGSVHMHSHQAELEQFVLTQREALNNRPSAFLSVSLSAASKSEEERQAALKLAEEFLAATGWNPKAVLTVAGALAYSRYGFLKRLLMRRIARKEGGDTDTSRDYAYTDWPALEAFLKKFLNVFE